MKRWSMLIAALPACLALAAQADAPGPRHAGHGHGHAPAEAAPLAASVAFDAQGRLWRASVRGGHVQVDRSDDLGRHFSAPVRVNQDPQKIGTTGDARPKLAFGPAGEIYLTWTQALAKPYSGYVQFARSLDGGASFSKPRPVHRDRREITHRFDALAVTDSGRIYVAWVDKRDLVEAQAAGRPYQGAAIYYSFSDDQGASFAAERKLADASCECCRIALQPEPGGTAVALWRHVFEGGVRDHAIARLDPNASPTLARASFGNWKIDACPHHGPALARGGDWGWHMAWFDGGERGGLYYARIDGSAWVTSPQKRFGDPERQPGHPALLSLDETVYFAWREIDAEASAVWLARSQDGGRSWEAPRQVARSAGASDHPQLVARGSQAFLAWNTQAQGLQVIGLEPPR